MGLYTKLADDIKEVDVIIAGGGTAACIVAGRLLEKDPKASILIIEGGSNNYNVPNVVHPALFLTHLVPTSTTTLFYKGNKAERLGNREPIVPCGGTLGGGSSINFMMYTRAQKYDFDSWQTPGWTADEMRPFLNKLETYHGPGNYNDHGHDGPIHVSRSTHTATTSEQDFIEAAAKVGIKEIEDLQNLDNNNGIQRWQRYISPDGKRQDTAHRYLHPKLQDSAKYPNLHVVCESKVVRVLIDENKRAVGVEFTPNSTFQNSGANFNALPKQQVKARKQVIVSCGACGTPPVLERSGVGDPKILKRAGVPVIVDLPGVGADYQDHNLVLPPYRTNLEPDQTLDALLSGRLNAEELIAKNDKLLGWNGIDISSKVRPTEAEVATLGPEFKKAWDKDFKNYPNKPLMLFGLVSCFLGEPSVVPPGQYVTVGDYTAYPYSRGHMHITGPDVNDELDFETGFFSDANDIDLKKQIWAYKKQRELMRRTKMYRGELALGHPTFPEGSKAACAEIDSALENVKDIEYTAEDDKAIEKWLRENIATTWHSLGTCKMAPRERGGVVKPNLDVYGVENLKIVDLSIPPENVGANTNNTALVIGERAADILINELYGLSRNGSEYALSRTGSERSLHKL